MAPTKQAANQNAQPASKKTKDVESILGNIKSTIAKTKAKIGVLKTQGRTKVTKSAASPKGRLSERKRLKQVLEDLATLETSNGAPKPFAVEHDRSGDDPFPSARSDLRINDFEIGRPLGRGKFGQVYLARHRDTDYICALKVISKVQCTSEEDERLIRRELEVHQNLAHPNILRFLSWFHNDTSIYLVLEYAPGGNLYHRLKKQPQGRFIERAAALYVAQMAEALRYMHSKNVSHRDIKPENILLGLHNEIKLADFGYSVHSESGFRSTVCGTLDYLSPEVAIMLMKPGEKDEYYTKAVDQWSLGVLTYELLVGKPPFEMKTREATEKKIANFKGKVRIPGHVSKGAEGLIRQLLNLDAEKRMSLEEVLNHPWIVRHVEKSSRSGLRSFGRMLEQAVTA
ncbi:Pkinase-domain-containing protein [Trematosphaeria pertusa]|uniref:Aurora kinase n=1 Tax=Trematosphaeria pertusa TaxID=390896 RepID=A0A6A6J418_9PLEO|nr:Pkinase-domain-containing protein [Trematosphaeria pertusa]KAF2256640.1 Pkinase-domain-containing protein [Trematosphaeria pertusa]